MSRVKNFLLTGRPGIGKTTAIISAIRSLDTDPGGFYTEEMRTGRERKGFEIVSLSNERKVLALKGLKSGHRVGPYGLDMGVMDTFAVDLIKDAMKNKTLIMIDEIGRMELMSENFKDIVIKALDSDKPVMGVIMKKDNEFSKEIKNREDTIIIEVTEANRDKIPDTLKTLVSGVLT
ncbi:AAA family ATPase [Methanocella sp. CWC-04]|uniref:AAA family ATPase n=1 Tax=Methanooceanicella nereidis TaxID=2052831 RepID=A0AAP2R9Y0_9EURY|nr:nucleoside-triphosphatase [Methanocella sp. CWC-04]MCD1293408.1 AAA family ATPase [Methanocella sp. CWC-04]